MGKNRNIVVPLPKWNWWQTALVASVLVLVNKIEPMEGLAILKELLKAWLLS